jgi:CubicO group peptidase (beta-lactamase class C family)/dienelactone hydrolase
MVGTALAGRILSASDQAGDKTTPDASVGSSEFIAALLEPIREKYKVPGLVAGIVQGDRLIAAGAVGLRKNGSTESITIHDKLHLGSDTKAMTATLLAILVEESQLSWKSTIGEVFPHLKPDLHVDFHAVTLEQLLTHRAGLPANGPWRSLGNGTVVEQREALTKKVLGNPPVHPPGSKYLYSNVGYAVAGHFAEQVTGKPWEELITARLFEPLTMTSAGFGFPGTKDQVDEPWGHYTLLGSAVPIQNDNAAALGPAGTVHCSLPDWAKFVALHLQEGRGEKSLLQPESFRCLHTPPEGHNYAGGWLVVEQPWTAGKALAHSGSNTFWFATVWLAPRLNAAFLAVANQGPPAGQQATDAAIRALIDYHEKSTKPQQATGKEAAAKPVEILKTTGGVRFGLMGTKPAAPAPTLLVFASDIATTLESDDYNKAGKLLAREGVLCVALDMPCHGQDARDGEPQGLDGWGARLRKDEDFLGTFAKNASAVLDHLIAEGYTDREKVSVCGTSRGGFVALHFAAAEPRVRCVAAFAPVTDLIALREFRELAEHAPTKALALAHQAAKLAGRPIWMCIGNNDERVDTDRAIAFTREVVKASVAQKKPALIEIHVMTSAGHTIHPTAQNEAAAWIAEQFKATTGTAN